MISTKNSIRIGGYVYSHDLELLTYGPNAKNPGVEYIRGNVNIATDEECLNVVPVRFDWVSAKYNSGKDNSNWPILLDLINNNKTVDKVGKSNAKMVDINCEARTNDFITRDNTLASPKQIVGNFIFNHDGAFRGQNSFEFDMLIKSYKEKQIEDGDDYGVLSGYVFGYQNTFYPIDVNVQPTVSGAMEYFDGCEYPMFTKLKGQINCSTVEREYEVESAFGTTVKTTTRSLRSWDVDYAAPEPYVLGDAITEQEIKDGLANRSEYEAGVFARNEARKQNDTAFSAEKVEPASEVKSAATSDFDFKF